MLFANFAPYDTSVCVTLSPRTHTPTQKHNRKRLLQNSSRGKSRPPGPPSIRQKTVAPPPTTHTHTPPIFARVRSVCGANPYPPPNGPKHYRDARIFTQKAPPPTSSGGKKLRQHTHTHTPETPHHRRERAGCSGKGCGWCGWGGGSSREVGRWVAGCWRWEGVGLV